MSFDPDHLPEPACIDRASPPGSWRAELEPLGVCALCRQAVCAHSDAEYQGHAPTFPTSHTGESHG
jgi:hypothetical protein